jgi:hypothetical protein
MASYLGPASAVMAEVGQARAAARLAANSAAPSGCRITREPRRDTANTCGDRIEQHAQRIQLATWTVKNGAAISGR